MSRVEKKIIKSPLSYLGSKKEMELRYDVSNYIPRSYQDWALCSPFCGSCVIELNHMKKSGYHHTFLNDINGDLINFWNVIRTKREEFEQTLKYVWNTDDVTKWNLNMEDEIDKAIYLYLEHQRTTNIDKATHLEKNISKWSEILNQGRLIITNKDYINFMDYTSKLYHKTSITEERIYKCLFYCDPPYMGTKSKHRSVGYDSIHFDEDQFVEKCKEMNEKGHFLLISYIYREDFIEKFGNGWYSKKCIIKNRNGIKKRYELLLSNEPFTKRFVQENSIFNY
jgi:site-specific DNA-adenine methylase